MTSILPKLRRSPIWMWLLLLALALRVFAIGNESFWFDEAFGARVTQLPFDQMLKALQGDNSPPLYYGLQWLISHTVGTSEATQRLPSAIMGAFAVLLLWQIALAIGFDKRTAWVAGLLAAVLPGTLYYGQEARMYALLLCAVLGAVLAAIKQRWLWYSLASLLALYSHNLGLVSVAALNIAILGGIFWKNRKHRTWPVWFKELAGPVLAMAAVVLLWLPWAVVEVRQTTHLGSRFWIPPVTIPGLTAPLFNLTVGERVAPSVAYAGYVVSLAFSIYALWFCRDWLRKNGLLILITLVVPPLLLALVSAVWYPVYLARVLIGSVYLFCLPWAYTIAHSRKLDQKTILALLIPLLTIGVIAQYWPDQTLRLPWRERVATIGADWQPGDTLYYCSSEVGVVTNVAVIVGYYRPHYPEEICPIVPDLPLELDSDYFGYTRVAFGDLAALGYKRAWFVVDAASDKLPDYPNLYCQRQISYPDARFCLIDLTGSF